MDHSKELIIIGENCNHYNSIILISASGIPMAVACSTCTNWNGDKCRINVYDSVKNFVQREDLI